MRTTNTPISPDYAPVGEGVLNKTAAGVHNVVAKVVDVADEAARKTIPTLAEYAHQTVDKVVTGAAPAVEWINEQAATLNAAQRKLVSSTRDYVAANPLTSLGIALAAGFLVSRIFRS